MSVIKTLLWKDYRHNRQFLIAAGILLLIPYAFTILVCVVVATISREDVILGTWTRFFEGASLAAMGISAVLCAFIAGNAIAGERVDRSTEFTAYLPISRRSAITSKAILAIGVSVLMLLVNSVIYCATFSMRAGLLDPQMFDVVLVMAMTALFVFGVPWLVSSLVSRPAMAASAGIVAVILLGIVLMIIEEKLLPSTRAHFTALWYSIVCLLVGPGCFIAGVLHYFRSVEP